jgi:metal-responsive CopG/Arc/MetJ family transcriptional regulator
MLDRPAASMLLPDEMVDMVDELIEAHGEAMSKGVRTAARKPPR